MAEYPKGQLVEQAVVVIRFDPATTILHERAVDAKFSKKDFKAGNVVFMHSDSPQMIGIVNEALRDTVGISKIICTQSEIYVFFIVDKNAKSILCFMASLIEDIMGLDLQFQSSCAPVA